MQNIEAIGNLYGKKVTVKQISKTTARKLYAQGIEIYLQSSKMHPFGMWQNLCPIKIDEEDIKSNQELEKRLIDQNLPLSKYSNTTAETQFNNHANSFRWYNCDSERGMYVHFYKVIN